MIDTAAWIYYRKGEFKKARGLLLSIEENIRNVPVLNYHLGMISFRLGEKTEARQYLRLAIDSKQPFPGRDEAERMLGELQGEKI